MQEKEKHISTTFIFASSSSRQYDDEPFKATYLNVLLYGFVQLIFYKILFLYSSNSTYICLSVDANHFSIFQRSVLLNFIWLFYCFLEILFSEYLEKTTIAIIQNIYFFSNDDKVHEERVSDSSNTSSGNYINRLRFWKSFKDEF